MNIATLQTRFNMPKLLTFEEQNGLIRANVHTPEATATIYLQGAHLTAWQPAGEGSVIFLSSKTDLAPGKPIRGGVPVVFPWFANDSKKDRIDGHPGPAHGFARVQDWSLEKVERSDGYLKLVLTLGPTEMSRSMGYDGFLLTMEFLIGKALTMSMTVKNTSTAPLVFEDAFHTYYKVADIHEVAVSGLEVTSFIDKTDEFKVKPAEGKPVRFTKKEDRVYNGTTADCVIDDVAGRRRIRLHKSGSNTTVVWNNFAPMPDLGEWDWHEYVAVETANAGRDAITLAPGESATMVARSTVEKPG
jgi:glucose-6-phosphate 1-epimerase